MGKIHDMAKCMFFFFDFWGSGVPYLGEMKLKVSFQLPPNRFVIYYLVDFQRFYEFWGNLDFYSIFLTIFCIKIA